MKSKGRLRKSNSSSSSSNNNNNDATQSGLANIKQICNNVYPLYNVKHQLTQFDIYAEGKVVKKILPNRLKKCKHPRINTNSRHFYTKKNNFVRKYVTDTLYVIRRLSLYTIGGNCASYEEEEEEEKQQQQQTLLNNDGDDSSVENGISVEQILEGLRKVTSDMLPINIITNNEYLAYILKYIISNKMERNTFRFIPRETFSNIKRDCKVMIWRVFDSNGEYTIDSKTLRNFHNNYTDPQILSYKKFHVYIQDLTAATTTAAISPKEEKKVTTIIKEEEKEKWRGEMMSIIKKEEEEEEKKPWLMTVKKEEENAFFVVKAIKDQVPRFIDIQIMTNNFSEAVLSGLGIKLTNVYMNEYLDKKND